MKRAISSSPAPPGTSSGLTESIATSSATSSRSVTAPPRRDRTLRVCGVRIPCRAGTLSAPNFRPTVRRSTREHRSRGSRCRIEGQGRSRAHRRVVRQQRHSALAFCAHRQARLGSRARHGRLVPVRRVRFAGPHPLGRRGPRYRDGRLPRQGRARAHRPARWPARLRLGSRPALVAGGARAGSTATGLRSSGWSSARAASATSSRPDSSWSGSSARTPTSPSLRTAGPSTARTRCST